MADKNSQKHEQARKKFKVIGFCLLIPGIICVLIAAIDFFTVMSSFSGQPSLFFLFFIGFPMIAGGIACLNLGYMGRIARYNANEINPVARDSINYMLDGTRDEAIKTVSSIKGADANDCICPKCGKLNDKNANYCDECGESLKKICKYCGEENGSAAKYCNNCGKEL